MAGDLWSRLHYKKKREGASEEINIRAWTLKRRKGGKGIIQQRGQCKRRAWGRLLSAARLGKRGGETEVNTTFVLG